MFEEMTFPRIMERCLARVDDTLDKREGSVIYDALAPCAVELAELSMLLSSQMDRAFPDTATDLDLTNKAKERGVLRLPATAALRRGIFRDGEGQLLAVPMGARFSGGSHNFVVESPLPDGAGDYQLRAETPGEAGNLYHGVLFPVDYIEGLGRAELTDVLAYGEEEENDERLRARYMTSLRDAPFGGNIADYRARVEAFPGVGACKVFPAWAGGGTVRLAITGTGGTVPSDALVTALQEAVDPYGYAGEGKGFAPIGHAVTAAPVAGRVLDVAFVLTLDSGYTWTSLRPQIVDAIAAYLAELTAGWADADGLVVRLSRIDAAVLSVGGVLDIVNTTLNGEAANCALDIEEIPLLGEVTNGA